MNRQSYASASQKIRTVQDQRAELVQTLTLAIRIDHLTVETLKARFRKVPENEIAERLASEQRRRASW